VPVALLGKLSLKGSDRARGLFLGRLIAARVGRGSLAGAQGLLADRAVIGRGTLAGAQGLFADRAVIGTRVIDRYLHRALLTTRRAGPRPDHARGPSGLLGWYGTTDGAEVDRAVRPAVGDDGHASLDAAGQDPR